MCQANGAISLVPKNALVSQLPIGVVVVNNPDIIKQQHFILCTNVLLIIIAYGLKLLVSVHTHCPPPLENQTLLNYE